MHRVEARSKNDTGAGLLAPFHLEGGERTEVPERPAIEQPDVQLINTTPQRPEPEIAEQIHERTEQVEFKTTNDRKELKYFKHT